MASSLLRLTGSQATHGDYETWETMMAMSVLELAFDKDEAARLRIRPKHREYRQSLVSQGKLVMAGPWESLTGALLIFEAADDSDMRDVLARDPYEYDTGAFCSVVNLRQWSPVFSR